MMDAPSHAVDSEIILNVGFDDTDSPVGMCTTFLAYKIAGSLCGSVDSVGVRRTGSSTARGLASDCIPRDACTGTRHISARTKFLDYPRLVRFNPNIPWKTRGNGAVSMRIKTADPQGVKSLIKDLVFAYADTKHGANPGLVFFEGSKIPDPLAEFGRLALWQLIGRGTARRFAQRNGLEFHIGGNGQGLIGAMGAIGYGWRDYTLELLSYRKPSRFGTSRRISPQSVKTMQDRTSPSTFNSFDEKRRRVMITPRGPDPVFYGIRGEDTGTLVCAAKMLRGGETPDGYMIFRTNQGTGDHLQNELTPNAMKPYASGWISGTVAAAPKMTRGGHVFFEVDTASLPTVRIICAVYKPTGIAASVAVNLAAGDIIRVGGGIRKASKNYSRVINVEYLHVIKLAKVSHLINPTCTMCGKRMKSKGQNQDFACARCDDSKAHSKVECEIPRKIKKRLYLPDPSAHRHLTRPEQRLGLLNTDLVFDDALPWLYIYKNSGE